MEKAHPPTGLVYFLLSHFNRFNKQKNQKSTVGKHHKKLSVNGIRELRVLTLVTLPSRKPSSFMGQGPACSSQPSCSVLISGRQDTLYARMQRTVRVNLLQERQRACSVGWSRLPPPPPLPPPRHPPPRDLKRAWLMAAWLHFLAGKGAVCCSFSATSYLDVSKEKEKP